ncbi:MAG: hypothetical protein OEY89_17655 [Gammaproteobacteria bacterium]|nr:hypothetical protein [Gammaproteobacteria bacterium]
MLLNLYSALIVTLTLVYLFYEYAIYRKFKLKNNYDNEQLKPIPETLVLLRQETQSIPDNIRIVLLLIAIIFFALYFGLAIILPLSIAEEQGKNAIDMILEISTALLPTFIETVFYVFMAFILSIYLNRQLSNERLILNETGINYFSPLPRKFKFLFPDWSINWNDIEATSLIKHTAPARLILKTKSTQKEILPSSWITPLNKQVCPTTNIFTKKYIEKIKRQPSYIKNSPLIRYIEQHANIKIQINNDNIFSKYDLNSNPKTQIISLILLFLVIYSVADFMFMLNDEVHISDPPWWIYSPVPAFIAASLFYIKKENIPLSTKTGLPLFLGFITLITCYPASLRINYLTDTEGLHSYEYINTTKNTFSPIKPNLPSINLNYISAGKNEYWNSIKQGNSHEFQLRKGSLGFYQLAMKPIYQKSRYWRCMQDVEKIERDPEKCDDLLDDD